MPYVYPILKWYLEERTFQVCFNQKLSSIHKISAGVPQGSVLGPILYLLYTADLPLSPNTMTTTFADDTAILSTDTKPEVASKNLQDHLSNVENWLNNWRIKVNESKSVHVTFTLNNGICPDIFLNGLKVPQRDGYKYLGVHLDRRLTWKNILKPK